MLTVLVFCFVAVTCLGQSLPVSPPGTPPVFPPGTPPIQPPPVRCGEIPRAIYSCLGNPKIVKPDISAKCSDKKTLSECERLRCIFKKSGWMKKDGYNVDKAKVIAHFDQFIKDQPEWTQAVQVVKTTCLSQDLPAQGVYINCPAYDIVHCGLTGFFRNAQPAQWSNATECAYPRQFAAACPVCPEDCFATAIPYGSCNACRLLPPSTP